MNIPSGGKLLTAAQTAQLGTMSIADKDALIAGIVSELRVQQMWRDKRSATWRERWGSVGGKPRRGKRRLGR